MSKIIAVLRVRGVQGVRLPAAETMRMLKLTRRNHLVLVEDSPSLRGMLAECKDYVAWGEVTEELVRKLDEKRGEKTKDANAKQASRKAGSGGAKQAVYRLHPPKGGFKSVKLHFPKGVLGCNGEKIIALIERML